jgi:hypothetical protein
MLGNRKHTTRWIKITSHNYDYKPWKILYISTFRVDMKTQIINAIIFGFVTQTKQVLAAMETSKWSIILLRRL